VIWQKKRGFSGFVADGDAGIVRGALDDEAALAKYARNGSWSPNERSLFKDLFAERGGTYLDIGANIGLTVIPIAQNPKIQCYAFEPEPNNFRYLSENVAVNCRAGNVRLLNVALFNKEATLPFEISPRHSGDNRLRLSKEHGEMCEHSRTVISVLAKRLDDVEIDIGKPFAVKIDVQGAEPFVIDGGRNTLSRADLLSVEFWPYSMDRMGGDINGLIVFLAEHFRECSISQGDNDEQVRWRPISSASKILHEFAENRRDRWLYLDVIVRK
jgi:FkbM family methyltransferase